MTEIPANAVTLNDLFEWDRVNNELKRLKAQEIILRMKLFKHHFTAPKEGTNTLELDPLLGAAGLAMNGMQLKGWHVINRTVDKAAFDVLKPKLAEALVKVDEIVKFKPELSTTEYRKLTEEQRHLVDQFLTIKPGTPSLEVFLPKKRVADK